MVKNFSLYQTNKLADKTADTAVQAGIELVKRFASLNGKVDDAYVGDNKTFMEGICKYAAEKAGYEWTGVELLNNPMVIKNRMFQDTYNAVVAQIITPVTPAVVSNQYTEMADVKQIGFGDTARFIVKSNDLFYVSDVAEGVLMGGLQRLYNDEITVNPVPKEIRYDMPFYQVASGVFDFGEWAYKIGLSFAAYIQKLVVNSLTSVIASGVAASSPYFASGYSDDNFTNISRRVKVANNNADVYALGSLLVLGKVIPTTVGLQYGLGEEVAKKGYLDAYKGVRLMELDQAFVPRTVNTTATFLMPDNVLYFLAMGANRPIKVVFEGQNVVVETVATETADKTMGMNIQMRIGISAVVGSKFGAITDIV
jgi:hypothetical protein